MALLMLSTPPASAQEQSDGPSAEVEETRVEIERIKTLGDRILAGATLAGTAMLVLLVLSFTMRDQSRLSPELAAELIVVLLLLGGAIALRFVAILHPQAVAGIFGGVTGYLLGRSTPAASGAVRDGPSPGERP